MTTKTYEAVIAKLREIGKSFDYPIYMVGGCVRDLLLGEPIKDIDLCIDCLDGAKVFTDWLKKNRKDTKDFVVYERFGTSKFTLVLDSGLEIPIECVMPRVETYNTGPRKPDSVEYTSLKIDATRRDFCCNALYRDVLSSEVIDPTGKGLEDLKNKILRTPTYPKVTFTDDPLRMLRALRFSYTKGFKIEKETKAALGPVPQYFQLSMERVRDEFEKLLMSPDPCGAIWELHETGLLGYIIPQLEEAWGFGQNSKYHSLNLSDHLLAVLDKVKRGGGRLLRWAALLHDISKYKIHETKADGYFSYIDHEKYSAEEAKLILRRLKLSEEDIRMVCTLIENHMILKPFYNYQTGKYNGRPKITRKVYRILHDELGIFNEEMKLIDADNLSHAPQYCMPGQVQSYYEALDGLGKVQATKGPDGKRIMKLLGLNQGKTVGEVKSIFTSWLDENPNLREEDLVERYLVEYSGMVWLYYDGTEIRASLNEFKHISGYTRPDPYVVPTIIQPEEIRFKMRSGEIRSVEAKIYPQLQMHVRIENRVRELIGEMGKSIDEFDSIPGFTSLNLSYEGGDLSAMIKWKDRGPTYIY